jgi:hypothetical protein
MRSNIEEIGAGALHQKGMFDRALGLQKLAAIGKTVWRDVQHAHDECALAQK